jgi:DNA-binding transcriptional MerR regulator
LDKAPDAFRTISEVASDLDVPQHVLRFWESRFTQIRPMKRAGGRRYYRADDVDLLRGIRQLLYGEGYTIRGVQRILKEHGVKFVQNAWQGGAVLPEQSEEADDAAAAALTPDADSAMPPAVVASAGARREPMFEEPKTPRAARLSPQPESRPAASGLAREDLRKLQAALHELGECRRLLDAALG